MITWHRIAICSLVLFTAGFSAIRADDAVTPTVEAAIAKDTDTKPTDVFSPSVPQLYAFFRSKGTHKGDSLRCAWIAEDVGAAAAKETKIDESTLTADQDDYYGAFSLSKPDKGWPPGAYRVEIYLSDDLVTTVKFTIDASKTSD